MTSNPPSSPAGSVSNFSGTASQQPTPASHSTSGPPLQTQPSTHQQNLQYAQAQSHTQTTPVARQNPAQTYYTVGYPPGNWQNTAWQLSGYPYATTGSAPYQQTHYAQIPYTQYQSYQHAPTARQRTKLQPKLRTPTPEPTYRHWDEVIRAFLKNVGLNQALKGFEDDMVVMNEDWERKVVPGAIGDLVRDMMTLGKYKDGEKPQERPLEDRKLDYIHLSSGQQPRSQSTITKSVSQFLAENRAKNDASNRSEFLQSVAEKRRRLNIGEDVDEAIPSCARTDMKQLDREVHMKYDIARNEDGPLRRTVQGVNRKETQEKLVALADDSESKDHPALDERLKNIEAHLAVRYVPAPPRNLLSRLQFLEDHIIQLEKEYPPWAALHFNQPHREWPPPPRQTPIIVPSHLTTQEALVESTTVQYAASGSATLSDEPSTSLAKARAKNKSSLHRAVMEKLEVQRAMSDLAGLKKGG
ncbi:hypothetical protein BKA82DRAFT_996192 [Pisolithus tinctorius]|uniref:Uncharacterized protein n=1 Tax=Pisolithus tinctorius Marx 270 TaxID=870435 RepID=A0A0C3PL09_PISTI|nr:hypothetical protein BKA82DRAFT_996192 [Pisolithus tinctorius]KIO09371.1 hypothetical protein M404DRAFT_996192 [Pisolithus tinctorius Marx 270]